MTIPSTTAGALERARTPITTIVRRLAVVTALALALFGASVPKASADAGDIHISGLYGHADFKSYGEILTVGTLIPKYGVRAILSWNNTFVTLAVKKGHLYDRTRNLVIPEGTKVSLMMCYTKHGHNVKCSKNRRGEA